MAKPRTVRQQLADINRTRTARGRQRALTLEEAIAARLINADGSPVDWTAYEEQIAAAQAELEPEEG